MTNIETNDLALTETEREAAEWMAARMNAKSMSLYRTSQGLKAFVVDGGGAEHLGVLIVRA